MKKFILILIASIGTSFYLSAQSVADYRSIGNGNWNDASKWESFNGNSWVNTANYPGENPGAGTVTIMHETEIKITATVPHPVANLFVSADYPDIISSDCESPIILPSGVLIFSSENAVSLTVTGDLGITGLLKIDNKSGAKTHTLFIGRNLSIGKEVYVSNCYSYVNLGDLQTINLDDKLGVTFNTTDPNSIISSLNGISFHDVTFNCAGIMYDMSLVITGTATFINGIVKPQLHFHIYFLDGSNISGGSDASHIDGVVIKQGDDPFTFPIGNEGVYAPLTISAPAGQESMSAYYQRNNGIAEGAITDPGLFSVSKCELWVLGNQGNYTFTYPFDVTVGWTNSNRCGSSSYITNVSDITLAYRNILNWNTHGGIGTGTPSNGSVTWSGITNAGVFTLGNMGTSCATPSNLTASGISVNSATISWLAVTGAQSYDVEYRSLGAFSWINAATATTSTSINITGLNPSSVYEWKVRANCSLASSSFRAAQFITASPSPPPVCNDAYETNNTSGQAKTIFPGNMISASISSAADVDWFKVTTPNNNNTSLEVTLSNLPADYDVYVYNKSLKLIGSSSTTGTSNEVLIYNSSSRKATYYIKVVGKNGAYNNSQCYNLLAKALSSSGTAYRASVPVNEITGDPNKQLLSPNPASEFVNFRFNSTIEGLTNLQIINTAGQLIKQSVIKITKGYNQVQIPVNDIRPGMYFLRINKEALNIIRKFFIAR